MAILVTGGTGYIGSVTIELLRARGDDVLILDDLCRGHRAAVDPGIPLYAGKVQDTALIERIAREHRIDSCIHFAALIEAGESVKDPAAYFENNSGQGFAFLRALTRAGINRVVFSSTAAVYGEPKQTPIPEDHPQWPANPYGWSKFFMERALEAYYKAYGLAFIALRYFNAAGATALHGEHHEPESHLVPNVIKAALGQRPGVSVFGTDYPTPDGTCVRDYIHVADLGSAHLAALDRLREGCPPEAINLGNGKGYTVLQVIETVKQVSGRDFKVNLEGRRAGDPSHLVAGAEKARRLLGWQPKYPELNDIVRTAWEWHLAHPRGYEDAANRT